MFTEDFLSNDIFSMQPLAHDRLSERPEKAYRNDGCTYHKNGDITLRLTAPNTKELGFQIIGSDYCTMEKGEDGAFTFTIPYNAYRNGPLTVDLYYDGTRLLSPFLPVYFSFSSLHNYLEFPDENQTFVHVKNVPHGAVSQQLYYSHIHEGYERCFVYTPPGYMNGTDSYPVLYLQHGGGENETVWESTGHISLIMDNLIAEGQCVPFIIVMNNDMLRCPGTVGTTFDHGFEKMLIEECIPFIEANYRVRTDKWSRAIGGLSMGSYLSHDIALFHPDKFGYFCALTGCMHQRPTMAEYVRPYKDNDACGKIFRENYRVFFQSATPQEDHLDYCWLDNELCRENGIADMPGYRFIVHDPHTTKWTSWRLGIRDFVKLIFREEAAYASREALKKYE